MRSSDGEPAFSLTEHEQLIDALNGIETGLANVWESLERIAQALESTHPSYRTHTTRRNSMTDTNQAIERVAHLTDEEMQNEDIQTLIPILRRVGFEGSDREVLGAYFIVEDIYRRHAGERLLPKS